jgi:hypothetical protein
MPTEAPGERAPAPSAGPSCPIISASEGQLVITGSGFLPDCVVTVRITTSGHAIVDYLTYTSDADGFLSAALPASAIAAGAGHDISVTDHRRDLAGDGGVLWSNTVLVTPNGR